MDSENISINMHIPRHQKNFCDLSDKNMRDLYIEAFEKTYLSGSAKLKKLHALEREIRNLEEEINEEREKSITFEEINYLKASKNSLNGTTKQLGERFKSFQRNFDRPFCSIEEFIKLIKQINEIQ